VTPYYDKGNEDKDTLQGICRREDGKVPHLPLSGVRGEVSGVSSPGEHLGPRSEGLFFLRP